MNSTSTSPLSIPQALADATLAGEIHEYEQALTTMLNTPAPVQTTTPTATQDPAQALAHLRADADHLRTLVAEREAQIAQALAELTQLKSSSMSLHEALMATQEQANQLKPLHEAIRAMVRKEIDAVLSDAKTNASLLAAISDEHEQRIRDIVEEELSNHTSEYDHDDYDRMDRRIDDIDNRLDEKADSDDVVSESRIEEMVSDAVREELESAVESEVSDAIGNYDMSDKICDYLHDNDYLSKDDIARMLKEAQVEVRFSFQ